MIQATLEWNTHRHQQEHCFAHCGTDSRASLLVKISLLTVCTHHCESGPIKQGCRETVKQSDNALSTSLQAHRARPDSAKQHELHKKKNAICLNSNRNTVLRTVLHARHRQRLTSCTLITKMSLSDQVFNLCGSPSFASTSTPYFTKIFGQYPVQTSVYVATFSEAASAARKTICPCESTPAG